MEEERVTRRGVGRISELMKRVRSYAAGILVEILTVAALCAAAVLVMLVVKALA